MAQRIGTQSTSGAKEGRGVRKMSFSEFYSCGPFKGISVDYTNYLITFLNLCSVCMRTIMSICSTDITLSPDLDKNSLSKYSIDRDNLKEEIEDNMFFSINFQVNK